MSVQIKICPEFSTFYYQQPNHERDL